MLDMYGEVASGLKACLEHMGPWSLGDLVLGLRHVKSRHEAHDVADNIPGQPVSLSGSPQTFQYLHRECSLACAAYSIPDVGKITAEANIQGNSDILHVHEATARFKPAFFVMKDAEAKLFRVVVRGTSDVNDILTDIAGHWEPVEGGFAHSGVLQSAEWLLDQTVPLLRDIPFQDSAQFGLRFSGHSLGAGTAALAAHILHTQPDRFPSLLATFPRARVDCFCASAPPVLSLALARSSADYITTLILGHDVVARASIANFEQLRLEVLTSGWWEGLVDPVVKSSTFQKVQEGLESAGAKELVELARSAGQAISERRAAAGDGVPPASVVESALQRLHDVYTLPTTKRSASAHSASSSHVGAVIESLLATSRERTRSATEALLDRVAVVSKKSPSELTSLAASAAAAAWKAAAAHAGTAAVAAVAENNSARQACKSEQLPGVAEQRNGGSGSGGGSAKGKEAQVVRSWLGGFMSGSLAACSAAYSVVSEATKEHQSATKDGPSAGRAAAGGAAAQRSMPASGSPAAASTSTRAPAPGGRAACATSSAPDASAPGAPAAGDGGTTAADVAKLDMSITAERLYAPGRLLHLRRQPRPDVVQAKDPPDGAPASRPPAAAASGANALPAGAVRNVAMAGRTSEEDGACAVQQAEEGMVLVDGDPMDARFEFIAVRPTWLADHSLTAMMRALEAAERQG